MLYCRNKTLIKFFIITIFCSSIFNNKFFRFNLFANNLYDIITLSEINDNYIPLSDYIYGPRIYNIFPPSVVLNQHVGMDLKYYLKGSYVFYDGLPYANTRYSEEVYKETAEIINDLKEKHFKNKSFSILTAPLHSFLIEDKDYIKTFGVQKDEIKNFYSFIDSSVKTIDVTDRLYKHKNEYLFYYSDHHWTSLSCYYAYEELMKALNKEYYPLQHYKEVLLTNQYKGSVYGFTGDETTKDLFDYSYGYLPKATISGVNMFRQGVKHKYYSLILDYNKGYYGIIGGDSVLAEIDIPSNKDKGTLLMIKDSFANGLIPYLVEHYSKIILYDHRWSDRSMEEFMKMYNIDPYDYDEVLFLTNFTTINSKGFQDSIKTMFN